MTDPRTGPQLLADYTDALAEFHRLEALPRRQRRDQAYMATQLQREAQELRALLHARLSPRPEPPSTDAPSGTTWAEDGDETDMDW